MIIAGGHSCVSSEQTNARKRVIINLLRILSIHVHWVSWLFTKMTLSHTLPNFTVQTTEYLLFNFKHSNTISCIPTRWVIMSDKDTFQSLVHFHPPKTRRRAFTQYTMNVLQGRIQDNQTACSFLNYVDKSVSVNGNSVRTVQQCRMWSGTQEFALTVYKTQSVKLVWTFTVSD